MCVNEIFNFLTHIFHIINFNIINKTAPGIPNIPTKIDVIKFNPIWNPHKPPIRFIIYIISPPIIELPINLNILLNGSTKIFPNITKNNIQTIKVIITLKSKLITIPYINYNIYIINNYD